jgi:hypothetical protein
VAVGILFTPGLLQLTALHQSNQLRSQAQACPSFTGARRRAQAAKNVTVDSTNSTDFVFIRKSKNALDNFVYVLKTK